VRDVREQGMTDVVLLGMGGSSLAPRSSGRSSRRRGAPALHVLDSTEPLAVAAVTTRRLATRSSSSRPSRAGRSSPTRCSATSSGLPADGRHFVASPTRHVAAPSWPEHELPARLPLRPEIGGRYSALSPFGIVPAALAGVDVQAVLEGAQVAAENCELPEGNSGLWLGAALGELSLRGRDKLTFVVDPPITSFGLWAEQLVAESTGKQSRGILPIADEPLLDAGAYGDDRVFLHLRDADAPDPRHAEAVRGYAAAATRRSPSPPAA
jgi:glucose-6-phosphate isomerase